MTEPQLSDFLQDILDAIVDIETFTAGVDLAAFQANRKANSLRDVNLILFL